MVGFARAPGSTFATQKILETLVLKVEDRAQATAIHTHLHLSNQNVATSSFRGHDLLAKPRLWRILRFS